ncbi:PepSY domain-containing protein [Myxococcaceae bacterium GXIMD 01537]
MSEAATSAPPAPAARASKRYPVIMKVVRRTHMYLGLLLFPWLLVFGVSGMLFNHPEVGEDVTTRELSGEQLRAITGLQPTDPKALAEQVVAGLNVAKKDGPGATYTLDPSFASRFNGFTVLVAPGDGVNHIVIVDLKDGTGTVATRSTRSKNPRPDAPFAGETVELPEHNLAAVEAKMAPLLTQLGLEAKTAPRANPRAAPELRFRMIDAQQKAWNVTYDLGSGRVDGRPADAARSLSASELLSRLHKQHHYPLDLGFTWVWALFADITAIMIVFWAVSGLFMWWQMKPTRVIGVGAISLAVGLGLALIGGTLAELQFGNVQVRAGPGDGGKPPPPAKPAANVVAAEEHGDH